MHDSNENFNRKSKNAKYFRNLCEMKHDIRKYYVGLVVSLLGSH